MISFAAAAIMPLIIMNTCVHALNGLPLEGYSFGGGPHLALRDNAITKQIVSFGDPVVPLLVRQLKVCNYNEACYIVFCLQHLKAVNAKNAIDDVEKQLTAGIRFREPHDSTLKLEIRYFKEQMEKPQRK